MINVYHFSDYKSFLDQVEMDRASLQTGFRSRLAEALACQNAYISQVLNTHANFSLEQALKICLFLGLNDSETKYFLLLVQLARSGTKDLQNHFQNELTELRNRNLNIKDRVAETANLTLDQQSLYYSSWIYPTIHMLITIADYKTPTRIADALKIEESQVKKVLLFLVSTGLAIESKGLISPGPTQIHLAKDSPLIRQHHSSWRIAAINSLSNSSENDIHYSTISSLSVEDAEKIKFKFVQVIADYVKTIEPSKEETLYNFNLDFYRVIRK